MTRKKEMTHEEHLILGKALSEAKRVLQETHIALSVNIGKSNTATKNILKSRKRLDEACCELDALYHAVTSNEQFEKHGHVYYGGRND